MTDKTIPLHIAVIMDGNGRWAKSRGLPRTAGHKKGAESIRCLLNACRDYGVRYLTVYAFSSENWQRPDSEIADLMQLLQHYLHQELQTLHENKVRLRFIGNSARLSDEIRAQLQEAAELTKKNSEFNFTIAISYGARDEITRAVRKIVEKHLEPSEIHETSEITEQTISAALDTEGLPDPDLLIRTGGEKRLSNFLLWQSVYTELYFTDILWPDFDKKDFMAAINDYAGRERRYGSAE